jgi:hypothetical protein
VRRANAFALIGNPDQALADDAAVLAREPDHADALFFTGAILAETAGADAEKRARARDAWRRFLAAHADDPRAPGVRERLARTEK